MLSLDTIKDYVVSAVVIAMCLIYVFGTYFVNHGGTDVVGHATPNVEKKKKKKKSAGICTKRNGALRGGGSDSDGVPFRFEGWVDGEVDDERGLRETTAQWFAEE